MKSELNPRAQMLIFGMFYLALAISLAVFTGGIADQAVYSSDKICLLYIENYQFIDSMLNKSFDAYSQSCNASISMGVASLFSLLVLALYRFWIIYHDKMVTKSMAIVLIGTCVTWSLVFLILASIDSVGLKQTCDQIEHLQLSTKSCGATFNDGFYRMEDAGQTHSIKNYTTVVAAVSAGWVTQVLWTSLGIYEYARYRSHSQRWW